MGFGVAVQASLTFHYGFLFGLYLHNLYIITLNSPGHHASLRQVGSTWTYLTLFQKNVPGPELEAGRACRVMSGCPEPCGCGWWPGTCCGWGFGTCMPCWALPSGDEVGTSSCWEGVEVGGRCRGRIFSAISCSLILLMRTRLSSWKG